MNDSLVPETTETNDFCPICQIPAKSLKIILPVHVSMCDVKWNELEECILGEYCESDSVFHYRDFSHQILAAHRENQSKRKYEISQSRKSSPSDDTKSEKENRVKRVHRRKSTSALKYKAEADDEENVFVEQPKKLRRKTCVPGEECEKPETEKEVSIIDESLPSTSKVDYVGLMSIQKPESIEATPDICISPSSLEMKLEQQMDDVDVSCQPYEESLNDASSMLQEQELDFDDWEKVEETSSINAERKEKCKAEWNQLFKNQKNTEEKSKPDKKKGFFGSKEPKECPHYKKMPGTGFAVDAFQFGSLPGITTYFLTHFHSDHYIGLKKSFSHPIYCSQITANLVKKKLRVEDKYLNVLELNQPIVLHRVEITCFDANHCPGAIMILFRLTNGEQYLHVGDFRASPTMEDEPELKASCITRLYLDTTYFNPHYVFPTQEEVIDRVRKIVREKSQKYSKALFVTGTYLIGKEKVFLGILEELGCKLWAQPQKRDVFHCIGNGTILSALTSKSTEAKIHVLPMNHLRFDRLMKHLLDQSGAFSHIFAFKPTGWEMGRKTGEDWINPSTKANITIFGVPYSEHSNFQELCRFINFIKADKVIPTVPMSNRDMYRFLKKIVDSYKSRLKQQNIEQFMVK